MMPQCSQDVSHFSKFHWPYMTSVLYELKACGPKADRQTSASQLGLSTNWCSWWHISFFFLGLQEKQREKSPNIISVLCSECGFPFTASSSIVFYLTCDLLLPSLIKITVCYGSIIQTNIFYAIMDFSQSSTFFHSSFSFQSAYTIDLVLSNIKEEKAVSLV